MTILRDDESSTSSGHAKRCRSYCFTAFPGDAEIEAFRETIIERLKTRNIKFCIAGIESCPTTGRMHVQGYFYSNVALSFTAAKNLLPSGTHIEVAVGSAQENIKYCSKDSRFIQFGEPPSQGKRTDLINAIDDIKTKGWTKAVLDNTPVFAKYFQNLSRLAPIIKPPDYTFVKKQVHWYYGLTGTGKSRMAFQHADAYRRDSKSVSVVSIVNDFIIGFMPESELVIFDEFRGGKSIYPLILKLTDGYPAIINVKGSFCTWNPSFIIFTCPTDPMVTFNDVIEAKDQLLRRLSLILYFNSIDSEPIERSIDYFTFNPNN